MAPLIIMLAAWLAARLIGATGLWLDADSWTGALRIALAAMFVFTAVSHFHPRTRPDMVRMVPARLPAPALLVSATGVLELLGAIGRLRSDRAACGDVPCERPRRTEGPRDCRSPRDAASLAPAAPAVLDRGPVVGSVANAQSLTSRGKPTVAGECSARVWSDLPPMMTGTVVRHNYGLRLIH